MLLRTIVVFTTSLLAFGATVTKSAAPADGVIEANIRAKFAKSKINEEHFKVTVKGGVALLEGATSVPQRKGVATRLAKTGGAREVVNKIEVSEAARRQMTERLQKARESKAASPKPASETKAAPKVTSSAEPKEVPVATESSTALPPLKRMQIKR